MAPRAILIRVGALGDTIHATAAATLLKRDSPETEVDFVWSKGLEGLLDLLPDVDRATSFPFRRVPLTLHPVWRRVLRSSEREPYQLAFLMETDTRFLPMLASIRAERKVWLPEVEARQEGAPLGASPVPLRYLTTLWGCGVAPGVVCHPRLSTQPPQRRLAASLLARYGLTDREALVGLHPGNSFRARKRFRRWLQKGDLRSWPEDRWVDLVVGLHRRNRRVQFVLFGGVQDLPGNQRIEKNIREREPGIALANTAGSTDLPLAAALLERFSLFLATDTGPIHMAAALGVPLLGLYGPTRFDETRPFPEKSPAVVIRRSLPCQPCYGTEREKACRDNLCMRSIEVEEVLEAIARMSGNLLNG